MILRGEQRRLASKRTPALTGLGGYADPLIRLHTWPTGSTTGLIEHFAVEELGEPWKL